MDRRTHRWTDRQTDGWTDRKTDRWMDILSNRDVLTHLKVMQIIFFKNLMFPQNLDEILGGEI